MSTTENPSTAAATDAAQCDSGRTVVDVRGPRFGAVITTVVLALVLVTIPSPVSKVLLAWQLIAFALGSLVGLQAQPYGVLFRKVVRPRLAPPSEFEDAAPPRFAQTVGLLFAVVGLVALLLGVTVVAYVAVAFALAAAFLNAAFAFCLGCEMYLLGKRLFARA
jgi:FtsH-binding integral membrane protein